MTFFNELKRRNVFRAGAAYLVVSWLLIQVVDTLGDMFSIPDGFGRGVVILLVIGFPVVQVISWVFELTSQGIQTQAQADDAGIKPASGKLNTVIIGGLVLALVFVVVDAYVLSDAPVVTPDTAQTTEASSTTPAITLEKSIAVLPFADLSPEGDQEYFSDGLSEELLNKLARVDDLLVAARTSSFSFKGKNEDMRIIGEQLNVNYILEGSVRKAGDQLRITAQLIQANNGFHLLSETYDRKLADVFAVQDEIAEAVTRALSITLGAGKFDDPGMTRNVEAYDLSLQSENIWRFGQGGTNEDAIRLGERAVELDPDSVLLWINLYRAYLDINDIPNAQAALDKARELKPDHYQVRVMDAFRELAEGNLIDAMAVLQAEVEDKSRDSQTLVNYAGISMRLGNVRRAQEVIQRAKRLDPLGVNVSGVLASSYIQIGQLEKARAETQFLASLNVGYLTVSQLVISRLFVGGNKAATAGLHRLPGGTGCG